MSETAVYGFCGEVVRITRAVTLTIQSQADLEATQHLFAHPACLRVTSDRMFR